jgi:DNA invertase Pin-like site-specific DNA recombinase
VSGLSLPFRYLRRSTDRQEQSIPDQQKAIERYAQQHGLGLLRFYTDDAISGTSTVGRRAFQALMADARSPLCDFRFVIVYDVKRFGRIGNNEAGYYRHLLRTSGIEVQYVTENFTGDRTDDLLRPVKQWQAREESKDLSKVTIRGLLSKSQTGAWMGGVPPLGYDLRYESESGGFITHVRHMPDRSKQLFDGQWNRQRSLGRGESLAVSRKDRCFWCWVSRVVRTPSARSSGSTSRKTAATRPLPTRSTAPASPARAAADGQCG